MWWASSGVGSLACRRRASEAKARWLVARTEGQGALYAGNSQGLCSPAGAAGWSLRGLQLSLLMETTSSALARYGAAGAALETSSLASAVKANAGGTSGRWLAADNLPKIQKLREKTASSLNVAESLVAQITAETAQLQPTAGSGSAFSDRDRASLAFLIKRAYAALGADGVMHLVHDAIDEADAAKTAGHMQPL